MTSDEIRILRAYVITNQASAVPKVKQLANCVSLCLAAHDDLVMPAPEVSDALAGMIDDMIDDLAQPNAPVVLAARSMLADLAKFSVSSAELDVLIRQRIFLFGQSSFADLHAAVDAGLRCIVEGGLAPDAAQRRILDDFVSHECGSVALAVTSLLRAVDAREAARG